MKIFCQWVFKFPFLSKTFSLQKLISASWAESFSYFQAKMTFFSSTYVLFSFKSTFFWCWIFLIQLIVKPFCWNQKILRKYFGSNLKKITILRLSENYRILIKTFTYYHIIVKFKYYIYIFYILSGNQWALAIHFFPWLQCIKQEFTFLLLCFFKILDILYWIPKKWNLKFV